MRLPMIDVAGAVAGVLHGGSATCSGAAIDSRAVRGGELFVPIVAERDGHSFVAAAIANGAAGWLGSERVDTDGSWIEVGDTSAALLDIGRFARAKLPDRVVGITGSVGKTTVKDLACAALSGAFATHASARSFNNELGVPLTLAEAPDDVEAVVVEMGARGLGHVALLCDVARPTIGVVTAVALAHAEMFGTIEEVAAAKGELIEALPAEGTAVLNADDPFVAAMRERTEAQIVLFGLGPGVEVTAEHVALDEQLRASFELRMPSGTAHVCLRLRGQHQVINALAAAAAAHAAGVDVEVAAAGLGNAEPAPHRMVLLRTETGAIVVDDAYNANPTSMAAALRSLAALSARRRVAVLGVMAELGPSAPSEHRRVAELAADLGIEVIAVDCDAYGVDVVDGVGGALALLGALGEGDAVLVKASRVAGLDRLVDDLSDAS
ncbi:MAG: UDP-N-acetylmuramoyl-tripeptide--D-alanyl-D-alanine ligase [Acidimicrobiales bacterium]